MDHDFSILCVDDEPHILDAFRRQLKNKFKIEIASSALQAIDLIKAGSKFAVVVSDMRMPQMDGVEFLRNVHKLSPLSVRVMLTGNVDQDTAIQAVNQGQIFRFVNKPCSSESLEKVLNDAVAHYRVLTAEKELLQNTLSGAIKVMSEILSLSDPYAFGFGSALREPAIRIAKDLSLSNTWELELACMLSPIGWIVIPENIKSKHRNGESLTPQERQILGSIPEHSYNFIRIIPRLENVAKIIRYSEKNYDGTGRHIDELKGDSLPEGSRILRIAKALVEAQAMGQSYSSALSALEKSPSLFDIRIVKELRTKVEASQDASEESCGFQITAKQLCVGQRLIKNLECADGRLLLQSGTLISRLLYKSILNYAESDNLKLPIWVDCLIPLTE